MILLQHDYHHVFGPQSGAQQAFNPTWIIVGVLAALVISAAALLLLRRVRILRMARADEDVFTRLCNANGLTKHQVYLLRRMYHEMKLDNPLLLFLVPGTFDRYEPTLAGKRLALVKAIRGKVFS
ncbi:MAG: hypothetical protein IT462_07815 [Planctomycetes bacterium]|nr:hypothetical protein [Planctomycetota bacterium]